MLLKTKYWRYFVRLCMNTGFSVTALRNTILSMEVGCEKRIGDYLFRLIATERESFGTIYRIEVYSYSRRYNRLVPDGSDAEKEPGRPRLILKSPVLLHAPPRIF